MTMIHRTPSYTRYARSLCPSWCSEPHTEQLDDNDFPAVLHECLVGGVEVLDISRAPATPYTIEARVLRYDNLGDGGPGATVLLSDDVRPMRPEDAAQVALLTLKAAEIARTS